MSTDPYAAIRRLPASFSRIDSNPLFSGLHADEAHMAPQPVLNADGTQAVDYDNFEYTDRAFGAGSPLAAFQSKFGYGRRNPDGTFQFNLQTPGGDKYDLTDVRYSVDPATGELVMLGDPSAFRQQGSTTKFLQGAGKTAAFVGGGALAGPLAGALGGGILGGAGAGALIGGGGALLGGADSEGALRSAAAGGIAGGIGGYMQDAYPQASYSLEGRNYANPAATQGIGGSPINASMALAERPISAGIMPSVSSAGGAFPSAGSFAPLDDFYRGGGASDMSTGGQFAGQGGHSFAVGEGAGPEFLGTFQDMPVMTSPGQSIDVVGNRLSPTPLAPSPGMSYVMPPPQMLEPKATAPAIDRPLQEVPEVPEDKPSSGNKFMDFLKNNPKLATTVLGMLGSKAGSPVSSGGLADSQNNLTAMQAPKFQRQYNAPPAGYRPGFDPEHRYFTGIGNTSPTPNVGAGEIQNPNRDPFFTGQPRNLYTLDGNPMQEQARILPAPRGV